MGSECNIYTVQELAQKETGYNIGSKNHVIIFDYDYTLVGRDSRGDFFESEHEYPDDYAGPGPHLFLNRETRTTLEQMKSDGFQFCIATKKSQTGTQEAHYFLAENGLSDLFDFIVFGRCEDNKSNMLDACIGAYPEGTQFSFLDDREANIMTAKEKGMYAVQVGSEQDNPYKSPSENSKQLASAVSKVRVAGAITKLRGDYKISHQRDLQNTLFGRTKASRDYGDFSADVRHAVVDKGPWFGLFLTRSKRILLSLLENNRAIEGKNANEKLTTLHRILNP